MNNELRNSPTDLYSVAEWGSGYFSINDQGELCVHPTHSQDNINLPALILKLREQGLRLPLLLRFVDILQHRVHMLYQVFAQATKKINYQGQYTAAYPIKVNQQASVVQEILRYPNANVGLECGSKPELMAVLALHTSPGKLIICNGYKDSEYLRLALMGLRLGHNVVIIVEKLSELEVLLAQAKELNVRPQLGVRVRLSAIGKGNWQNTGGEKAKFGLSSTQLLNAIEILKKHDALDCLIAMHFHMGSQIANIQDIQAGLQEAAYYYVELKRQHVPLRIVDVGGGVGIDYEGSVSRSFFSLNYSLSEYAENVLHIFAQVSEQAGMEHPDIVTEVGRAMTAHHAVLITEVIDVEQPLSETIPFNMTHDAEAPSALYHLWEAYSLIGKKPLLETYHNVVYGWQDIQNRFNTGSLSLPDRAQAEQLYVATCRKIFKLLDPTIRAHREVLDELKEKLATKYFANFSLFQSIPDSWALKQVFPVLPLNRLKEPLNEHGVIADLTCDSDGCLKQYLHNQGTESVLSLPAYKSDSQTIMGIFLVGAYQEILGDMHNLFGDTDAVNIRLLSDGLYTIEHVQEGNSVIDVLRYVNFDIAELKEAYRKQVAQASLSPEQQHLFLTELNAGLEGYTYLED